MDADALMDPADLPGTRVLSEWHAARVVEVDLPPSCMRAVRRSRLRQMVEEEAQAAAQAMADLACLPEA